MIELISEHDEIRFGHEELYLLVAGKATFTVDGEDAEAVPGTAVFVRDADRGYDRLIAIRLRRVTGVRPAAVWSSWSIRATCATFRACRLRANTG